MNNIKKLPLVVSISNLYENYKSKQNDLMKFKINFLFEQAYQNFYDQYVQIHIARIGNDIDLHPSIYAQRDAKVKAIDVVLQVVADDRIDSCYSKRIKQLNAGVL